MKLTLRALAALLAYPSAELQDNVAEVRRVERELIEWFHSRHAGLMSGIASDGTVDADALESGITAFAAQFVRDAAHHNQPGVVDPGDADTVKVEASYHLPEEESDRDHADSKQG